MSEHTEHGEAHGHDEHHPPKGVWGFVRTYIFSTDHKMIGKQFLITGLLMFVVGGALALGVRAQIAYPHDLPWFFKWVPKPLVQRKYDTGIGTAAQRAGMQAGDTLLEIDGAPVYTAIVAKTMLRDLDKEVVEIKWKSGDQVVAKMVNLLRTDDRGIYLADGRLGVEVHDIAADKIKIRQFDTQTYNMMFTMHASVMIFLVIIPLLTGAFGNFLIPLQIGARDMAFPKLNMLSYWLMVPAAVFLVAGFFVPGGHAASGWTGYPPLSNKEMTPSLGQTLWVVGVLIIGFSSVTGAVNYIATIVKMRAPGMTYFRMPLSTWALFITAILVLFGTPVLTSAMTMLLMDRTLGTSFFKETGGGVAILWQHLFWFYSHPAVYIMILPGMGMVSDILATFARKPIFGYRPMIYSISGIAFLGFIVWGHHMFQSGMNPALGMTFMASTTMIALPSAIKTFNWLGTLWRANIILSVPMLNALAFVSMFVIGGLSGIFMSATVFDIYIHDTYFIVAHIHYVLFGGSMFAIFAGVYYWFPKMYGRMMNNALGHIHFIGTFIFFNLTFFPMHIIGIAAHPRRIAVPWDEVSLSGYNFLRDVQPLNVLMTNAAFLLGVWQVFFAVNFFYSLWWGKKAGQNPWKANTLEWVAAPTPTPHGNFGPQLPVVYHGPYEYASPLTDKDYLPQTEKVG